MPQMTHSNLILYLNPKKSTVDWLLLDAKQKVLQGPASAALADIAKLCKDTKINVIVPGQHVLLTQVDVPPTSYAKLLQAIPFALEEQLSDDVENLHFALGICQKDQAQNVAIIQKKQLQTWLDLMGQYNIQPHILVPEALALPFTANQWSIVLTRSHAIIRTQNQQGCSIDRENCMTILPLLLNQAEIKPKKVILYTQNENDAEKLMQKIQIPVEIKPYPSKIIELFKSVVTDPPPLNLLQGEFKIKQKLSTIKKLWLSAAALFLAFIFIAAFSQMLAYFYLNYRQHKLDQEIARIYHQIFPQASSVISPKIRVQRKLNQLRHGQTDQGILALLAQVGPILRQQPTITLQQLNYRNQRLNLNVSAPNFQALEKLTRALRQRGLKVKQSNAKSSGKKVTAELVIQA